MTKAGRKTCLLIGLATLAACKPATERAKTEVEPSKVIGPFPTSPRKATLKPPIEHFRDAFSIALPDGYKIEEQQSGHDFNVFMVKHNKNPVIGLYVGNWPENPRSNDVLIETGRERPAYLHAWRLPEASSDKATTAILASITAR